MDFNLLCWAILSLFFQKLIHGTGGTPSATYEIGNTTNYDGAISGEETFKYPVIKYSPEEIFANKVPILDINFIKPSSTDDRNSAHVLQSTIAGWYVALRTLALVGMLSVLVYIGIKILLSSIASDKAKYKTMLKDWIVGICILLFLHYIMYFILVTAQELTKIIGGEDTNYILVMSAGTIGGGESLSFTTNLIGLARFLVQYRSISVRITYLVIYGFMTWYTIRFTWLYIKRVAIMALMTIIAPIVAFMYPIDKIGGGTTGFNNLIKHYCVNAFTQPFHRLIYTVLITSAMTIATTNPIYAIVILAFMSKATDLIFSEFITFGGKGGGALGMGLLTGAATAASKAKAGSSKSSSEGKDKVRTKANPDERGGKDKLSGDKPVLSSPDIPEKNKSEEETEEKNKGGPAGPESPKDPILNDAEKEKKEAEEKFSQAARQEQEQKEENTRETAESQKDKSERKSDIRKKVKKESKAEKKEERKKGIRGAITSAPTAIYRGARGAAKTASKVAFGAAAGLGTGAIKFASAAARGDTNAFARAAEGVKSGAQAGAKFGGQAFENTIGKGADAIRYKVTGNSGTLTDQYRRNTYGSVANYKRAASDKAFMKDANTDEYMRENFEKNGKLSKDELEQKKREFLDYRKDTGVTDKDIIKRALASEEKFVRKYGKSEETIKMAREMGKNAASLAAKNKISDQAWTDDEVYKKEQKNIADTLKNVDEKQKMAVADEIMQSIKDMKYS